MTPKEEFVKSAAVSGARSAGTAVGTVAPYLLIGAVVVGGLWYLNRRIGFAEPIANAAETAARFTEETGELVANMEVGSPYVPAPDHDELKTKYGEDFRVPTPEEIKDIDSLVLEKPEDETMRGELTKRFSLWLREHGIGGTPKGLYEDWYATPMP